MNKSTGRYAMIVVGLAAALAFTGLAVALEEVEVTLDQVPPAVREAILREAAGAKVTEIERETKNGQTYYEAEFKRDGHEIEIKLSADGAILGREVEDDDDDDDDMTLDQLPPAAAAELKKCAGAATIREIEVEREDGVIVYEAQWTANGTKHEASVTADGQLLEFEERVAIHATPAAVQAAIAKHFGSGDKVVVEKKTIVVYEAEARVNGVEKEIYIYPTGRVHAGADDDDQNGDDDDDDDDD